MLCSVWDVVFVLSQKNEPWSARANSKHCDCLHTRSRIVVSVKSAITAIKVISYVYSNHFGVIFSPTKVAKVFFFAKKSNFNKLKFENIRVVNLQLIESNA